MRVVFVGTPEFAADVLESLAARHEIVAVYTQPDRPRGRGRALVPSPVKSLALDRGIPVEQPQSLRDPSAVATLAAYRPDVVVVAAYGCILPPIALAVPRFGCVNVHASLLPRHRGAAPVQRAILEGDEATGVSIMLMEEGLDTGQVAETVSVAVLGKSADELTHELAGVGADALLRVLTRIEDGTVRWEPQDETGASYAEKIRASDVALDPSLAVVDAARRVRASGTSAASRAEIGGHKVIVTSAHPVAGALSAGEVEAGGATLLLGFSDGVLAIDTVVPEGKREMPAPDWLRGARLPEDATWSSA